MITSLDESHMARALQLAGRGLYTTDPNPRVGCVLAKAGAVIGEGGHERAGGPHAERMALERGGAECQGASAFVTLEPCSHIGRTGPCVDALIEAGIERVVVPYLPVGWTRDALIPQIAPLAQAGRVTWLVNDLDRATDMA